MKKYTEPEIEITEYVLCDIIAVSTAQYSSVPETPVDDGPITDLDDF